MISKIENFKYPTINVFFDADNVPCIFVNELEKAFPFISKLSIDYLIGEQSNSFIQGGRKFNSFSWDIGDEIVMACRDAEIFVDIYRKVLERCKLENVLIEDIEFGDICKCSVCDVLLFPDDEAYSDEENNAALCDKHSIINEETNNYKNPTI